MQPSATPGLSTSPNKLLTQKCYQDLFFKVSLKLWRSCCWFNYSRFDLLLKEKQKKITHLILKNIQESKEERIEINALFPCVGMLPYTSFLHGLDVCDGKNYIAVDEKCETKIPGLFAAGDVIRPERIKQIATAAGDGAIAAQSVIKYLEKL